MRSRVQLGNEGKEGRRKGQVRLARREAIWIQPGEQEKEPAGMPLYLRSILPLFAASLLAVATFSLAEPAALPDGVSRVAVVFSGGHDTEAADRGRPVMLIAAALGVKPEVFRAAFSHVHPAGPGSGGPTEAEARANKAALLGALGSYGVTNERLDAVSDFYRYPPGRGGLWKNTPASANALVKDGVVVGYEVTDGGAGYTTAPTVSVPGIKATVAPTVEIRFGKDLPSNGVVSALRLPSTKDR